MFDPENGVLKNELDSIVERIGRLHKEREVIESALTLTADVPEMADVRYVSVGGVTYGPMPTITLALQETCKDSKLAHALAKLFQVKFEKSQTWTGESLDLTAEYAGVTWRITGYLGTCELIRTEIPLSKEEIKAARQEALKAARKSVRKVRVVTELRCGHAA